MKTQAPAPIKTIYYTDERNDEFSSAKIETRRIDESYRYIDPRPGWKAFVPTGAEGVLLALAPLTLAALWAWGEELMAGRRPKLR